MTATAQQQSPARVQIPKIIYGTAWKKERTEDLVIKAFRAGFRGIDTACQPRHYNEPLVGAALNELHRMGFQREDYYLQTKYTPVSGQDPDNIPYNSALPITDQVQESFEVSLANLGVEQIDALILHSPFPKQEDTFEAWQAMESIVKQGGCRLIGISNCYDFSYLQALYEQSTIKPSIVQNRFYDDTGYDYELRQWCIEHQIIYQSFWTLTANPHILNAEPIQTLVKTYSRTAPQIMFAYLSQRNIVPLTGTSSLQHMAEDLASVELVYTEAELESIDRLLHH